MIKVIFSNDWYHLPFYQLKETLYSIQTQNQ
jgi:hypothetical protein